MRAMVLPMTDVALCFMQAFWAIIVSTLIGLLGGGFTATVYFTLLNLYAQDGPYFSAVLIALVSCYGFKFQGRALC